MRLLDRISAVARFLAALLLIGDPWVSARAFVTAFVGCISLAAGLHGYFLGPASRWQRVLLVAAALGLIDPTPIMAAVIWARGARSPLAPTDPCAGTTGVNPRASIA